MEQQSWQSWAAVFISAMTFYSSGNYLCTAHACQGGNKRLTVSVDRAKSQSNCRIVYHALFLKITKEIYRHDRWIKDLTTHLYRVSLDLEKIFINTGGKVPQNWKLNNTQSCKQVNFLWNLWIFYFRSRITLYKMRCQCFYSAINWTIEWACLFISFVCPLGLTINLDFNVSKVAYWPSCHINAMLHDVLNFRRSAQTPAIRVASYVAHGNRDACMWCCSYSLEALVDSRLINWGHQISAVNNCFMLRSTC